MNCRCEKILTWKALMLIIYEAENRSVHTYKSIAKNGPALQRHQNLKEIVLSI